MSFDLPSDDSSDPVDPPVDLSKVFRHPQGLPTARSIVTLFLLEAQKAAQGAPPPYTQQMPFLYALSMSGLDPSGASRLKELLEFNDPQPQTSDERLVGTRHATEALDKGVETTDRSHLEPSPTVTVQAGPSINAQRNHMSGHHNAQYSPFALQPFSGSSPQTYSSLPLTASNSFPLHPVEARAATQFTPTNNRPEENNEPFIVEEQLPSRSPNHTVPSTISIRPIDSMEIASNNPTPLKPSQIVMEPIDGETTTKKRKKGSSNETTDLVVKKRKTGETIKPKRVPKPKVEKKKESVFDHNIYMRILEFTPPAFLSKARLISKEFRGYVDEFTSIYANCRKENFGYDMPPPPPGLTERQYSGLLGGQKGCLEPGCSDKKASRTHWSWSKRWCWDCWKSKIEREDRVMKSRAHEYGRTTLTKMLECIPVGMHDSFMKPHDYIDEGEPRPRGAPRLYKYYLTEDIERIIKEYEALTPAPYVENPEHSAAEKAAALAAHQALMDGLDDKRAAFFAAGKAKNDAHMAQVKKIEAGIRMRRARNRDPYDENRNSRKELFSRRAKEDLPHIDEAFVKSTKAYKAATRIFRDGGTERGWQTLRPKIVAEWEAFRRGEAKSGGESNGTSQPATDPGDVNQAEDDDEESTRMEVDTDQSEPQISNMGRHDFQLQAHARLMQFMQPRPQALVVAGAVPVSNGMNYVNDVLSASQSLPVFSSSVGSNSAFGSSARSSMSSPDRRLLTDSGTQLSGSRSLPAPGYHQASYQYFQSASLNANGNASHVNSNGPSTQISITSLLRPPTPTASQPKFNHLT